MRGVRAVGVVAPTCLALALPVALASQTARPPGLGDGWTTAAPGEVGLNGGALTEVTEVVREGAFGNVHAILIERHGQLAYEAYFAGADERRGRDLGRVDFDVETPHDLRSVTKSVVSALIGIAVATGDIPSVRTPIADLLPDRRDLLDGEKSAISLHHLLTMSSGLEWDESLPYSDPRNDERRLDEAEDPVGFVLGRPLLSLPGSTWTYSGGSTQLLGAILERVTGRPLAEYASEVLFGPLGITDVDWAGDLAGTPAAASGLRLRARDVAKFGSLYLNGGRWNGGQVLPQGWIGASTRSHIENPDPSAPPFVAFEGYGYQWWVNTYETPVGRLDVATAVGNGGQRIIVIPSLRIVVTVLAGFYNDPRHFWTPERLLLEHILPAVTTAGP